MLYRSLHVLLCKQLSELVMYLLVTIVVHTGFFVQVGIATFNLFWIFHVFHVFAGLAFPLKMNRIFGSTSYKIRIYAAEITLIFIVGFLPSIVIVSTSGYQYSGLTLTCFPTSSTVFFYTLVFPLTFGSVLGTCFLFSSFWILRKVGLF